MKAGLTQYQHRLFGPFRQDRTRINPKLGKLKVASVTSEDVKTFVHSLSPGSAKCGNGLLGAIFSFAVKKGCRDTNPCAGVEKAGLIHALHTPTMCVELPLSFGTNFFGSRPPSPNSSFLESWRIDL
jgi:hypothetical protein